MKMNGESDDLGERIDPGEHHEFGSVIAGVGRPPGEASRRLAGLQAPLPERREVQVEIPSTEGPGCLMAVLEEAERLHVPVHRVSQGSGALMLTDA
jgi:hypothetical protein